MADDVLDPLARALRVSRGEVQFLAPLDVADLTALRGALDTARARQEAALAEAFEGTIRLVPRPLRGRVRRLLTGG